MTRMNLTWTHNNLYPHPHLRVRARTRLSIWQDPCGGCEGCKGGGTRGLWLWNGEGCRILPPEEFRFGFGPMLLQTVDEPCGLGREAAAKHLEPIGGWEWASQDPSTTRSSCKSLSRSTRYCWVELTRPTSAQFESLEFELATCKEPRALEILGYA
jgi:hypothetical protein